jgi:hypothetical protein
VAYDEALARRVRDALGARPDVAERKMFGGMAFLAGGKMFCGVVDRDSMVRVGANATPTRSPSRTFARWTSPDDRSSGTSTSAPQACARSPRSRRGRVAGASKWKSGNASIGHPRPHRRPAARDRDRLDHDPSAARAGVGELIVRRASRSRSAITLPTAEERG